MPKKTIIFTQTKISAYIFFIASFGYFSWDLGFFKQKYTTATKRKSLSPTSSASNENSSTSNEVAAETSPTKKQKVEAEADKDIVMAEAATAL